MQYHRVGRLRMLLLLHALNPCVTAYILGMLLLFYVLILCVAAYIFVSLLFGTVIPTSF